MTDFLHKKQSFNSFAGTDYKKLKYAVTGAKDPVSAEFDIDPSGTVVLEDGSPAVVEFQVQQDAEFTRTWSLIDESGNETEAKSKTSTAVDDHAGDAPEEIGDLVTTGEHSE